MSLRSEEIRPFNSPLETGMRSVTLLVAAFPMSLDLQRLVAFDHLVVHTEDLGGPESLHPRIPMRSAELLVRRGLIERGLMLMMSRGLVQRSTGDSGFHYQADEFAETFMSSLESPYLSQLKIRAEWVLREYGPLDDSDLRATINDVFDRWLEEFQSIEISTGGKI